MFFEDLTLVSLLSFFSWTHSFMCVFFYILLWKNLNINKMRIVKWTPIYRSSSFHLIIWKLIADKGTYSKLPFRFIIPANWSCQSQQWPSPPLFCVVKYSHVQLTLEQYRLKPCRSLKHRFLEINVLMLWFCIHGFNQLWVKNSIFHLRWGVHGSGSPMVCIILRYFI